MPTNPTDPFDSIMVTVSCPCYLTKNWHSGRWQCRPASFRKPCKCMTDGQYGLQCKWEGHNIVPAMRRAVVEWLRDRAQKNRDRLTTTSGRQRHANYANEDDRLADELERDEK